MRQGEVKVDLIGSAAHPCGRRGTVPLANTGTQVSMATTWSQRSGNGSGNLTGVG